MQYIVTYIATLAVLVIISNILDYFYEHDDRRD